MERPVWYLQARKVMAARSNTSVMEAVQPHWLQENWTAWCRGVGSGSHPVQRLMPDEQPGCSSSPTWSYLAPCARAHDIRGDVEDEIPSTTCCRGVPRTWRSHRKNPRCGCRAEMDRLVMTSVTYDSSTSSKRMPKLTLGSLKPPRVCDSGHTIWRALGNRRPF
jgi:hypothetical protein